MDEKRPAPTLHLPGTRRQAFQLGHLGAQFAAGPFGLAGAFRGALAGLVDLDDVLVDIVATAVCCSAAAAICWFWSTIMPTAPRIFSSACCSLRRLVDRAIGGMVAAHRLHRRIDAALQARIICSISAVDYWCAWPACASSATTAKPRPCSPALSGLVAALSASRWSVRRALDHISTWLIEALSLARRLIAATD